MLPSALFLDEIAEQEGGRGRGERARREGRGRERKRLRLRLRRLLFEGGRGCDALEVLESSLGLLVDRLRVGFPAHFSLEGLLGFVPALLEGDAERFVGELDRAPEGLGFLLRVHGVALAIHGVQDADGAVDEVADALRLALSPVALLVVVAGAAHGDAPGGVLAGFAVLVLQVDALTLREVALAAPHALGTRALFFASVGSLGHDGGSRDLPS